MPLCRIAQQAGWSIVTRLPDPRCDMRRMPDRSALSATVLNSIAELKRAHQDSFEVR